MHKLADFIGHSMPCFEEDDACLNLPNTSLLLCYNPAQVLKMGGKHYLTGPVILVRTKKAGQLLCQAVLTISSPMQIFVIMWATSIAFLTVFGMSWSLRSRKIL